MAFGSHPLHALDADARGEMDHPGGRRTHENGGFAERARSHRPFADSGRVREAYSSSIERGVREGIDRIDGRSRTQARFGTEVQGGRNGQTTGGIREATSENGWRQINRNGVDAIEEG